MLRLISLLLGGRLRSAFASFVGALLLAGVHDSSAVTLYSTTFDDPFSTANYFWAGVDGWNSTDPSNGSAGVVREGGAVYLGAAAPSGTFAVSWKRFSYDPVARGTPIVRITTSVAVFPPRNGHYDTFGMLIYSAAGPFLGGIFFDTYTQSLYYDGGNGPERLPGSFNAGAFFRLTWTMDFSTNRTSGYVRLHDGTLFPLFERRSFHELGKALNLGDLSFLWMPSEATPGDNYIVVDSLSVEAFPPPKLAVDHGRTHRTRSSSFTLRGTQASDDDVQVQWRTKSHRRWSPVKGKPTWWSLRVKPLLPGRNTVDLRLLNAMHQVIDHQRVTITRK